MHPSAWPRAPGIHMSHVRCATPRIDQRAYRLWSIVGHVCNLFSDEECYNYSAAADYEEINRHALTRTVFCKAR